MPSPPLADPQDHGGQGRRAASQSARTARTPPGWRSGASPDHASHVVVLSQTGNCVPAFEVSYQTRVWIRPKICHIYQLKKFSKKYFFWVDSVAGIFFSSKKSFNTEEVWKRHFCKNSKIFEKTIFCHFSVFDTSSRISRKMAIPATEAGIFNTELVWEHLFWEKVSILRSVLKKIRYFKIFVKKFMFVNFS